MPDSEGRWVDTGRKQFGIIDGRVGEFRVYDYVSTNAAQPNGDALSAMKRLYEIYTGKTYPS